jgi:hypothetical protein
MNHDNNYRERFTKLGALLICRAANLHGLELENLTVMLVLFFNKKREWGFRKASDWVPWFPYNNNQECRL